ncbi:hypothetical protein SHJG_8855 [Streptomyces hygroscopicus subsp. jinggangensis 5008]|nr:hypothetical protein SHJG_1566 [Streptomyces hygroscopicus subsp. jinggangensis 5008]AEY94118.1 hypothetical protein SHJG_8855 [Streptomyces hygroscopicus subsp. jinggangensis 5008]AGF61062.1 hypothetical protein SHJGH_1396 [Streptomyces hygroscopicus subsp. jinggangensis TL01]AGF68273.1 hypothetical protein SHJGH_8611 [Streptomyces hygroscopicus subsp. jinggangensis TL01]
MVVRPTYWKRPSSSYRPSSSVRGGVGEPVTAPTIASPVSRTYW